MAPSRPATFLPESGPPSGSTGPQVRHDVTRFENRQRTQREVAGVAEVTIRNRYRELTEKLGIKIEL